MKVNYYKAMKITSREWWEKVFKQEGFEEISHETLEEELNLPSYEEFMTDRRLNFAGTVISRNDDDKTKIEMMENKRERGGWYKMLEEDMEKVGIKDEEDLKMLKKKLDLKSYIKDNYQKS